MSIAEKLTTVAENQQKVYEAGYEKGKAEGGGGSYDEGYTAGIAAGVEQGKQAERGAFWDSLQLPDGSAQNYSYAFARWPDNILKPTHNVYPTNGQNMFDNFNSGRTPYTDLTTLFKGLGVKLDTSRCTNFNQMFYYAWINRVPEIDTRAASDISGLFLAATRVVTIDKIILKDDGSQILYKDSYGQCFYNCTSLVNVEFEGVIGSNIDFRQSKKLSAKSMASTVEHLSTTTSGKTAFFSQEAVNNADWSTTEYESWSALVDTKPNWSFTLA